MANVKRLREMFERGWNRNGATSTAKPLTPSEFADAQKKAAEAEAKAVLDARRKAATYNMTVRALQIKMNSSSKPSSTLPTIPSSPTSASSGTESKSFASPSNKSSSSNNNSTTNGVKVGNEESAATGASGGVATNKVSSNGTNGNGRASASASVTGGSQQARDAAASSVQGDEFGTITPLPNTAYDKKKMEIREKARKYSIALTEEVKNGQTKASEIMQQKERRATQILLKSITADVEKEIAEEMQAEKEKFERERAEKAKELEEAEKKKALENAKLAEKEEMEKRKKKEEEDAAAHAAALAEEENNRVVLTSFLKENHPDRLGEVDMLLKEYKGHLDILFEELAKAEVQKSQKESSQASTTSTTSSSDEQYVVPSDVDQKTKEDLKFLLKASEASSASSATKASSSSGSTTPKKTPQKFLDDHVSLGDMLTQFYTVYAPIKIKDIPTVLKHFEGREKDLIHTLEIKYNVTFMPDGTCTPNDATTIGEIFLVPANLSEEVQRLALQEQKKKTLTS